MTLFSSENLLAEIIYRVKQGDTLTGIAKQHGVPLSALVSRNNLRSTDGINIGQRLTIPGTNVEQKAEVDYVVKSGDSLATIAQKFGVTTSALAKQNNITEPNKIKPGQRLQIPGAIPAASPSGLATDLKGKLDRITVSSKRWKNIVIHHSGTTLDTLSSMDSYHRNERRMENGLAYHFVIGNGVRTKDGEIYIGRRWSNQLDGGHLSSVAMNRTSIGICLVGDFNKKGPSEKQLEALRALTTYLMDRCGVSKKNVQTHRQINVRPTECPGSKFPTQKFLATLP